MPKITNIDKKTLQSLRDKIEAALAPLGEELGLNFRTGNGSYGGNEGHFKLEMKIDDPAIQEAAERETFDRNCRFFDLEPQDFGAEFRSGGKQYKLVGLAINRTKYPLKVKILNEGGKSVLLTDMAVPMIKAARVKAEA